MFNVKKISSLRSCGEAGVQGVHWNLRSSLSEVDSLRLPVLLLLSHIKQRVKI